MEQENKSRGKVTVGYGTAEQREIEVVDFLQAEFKDHRLVCVSSLEDGSMVGCVENPPSSGRAPQSYIWLSKESFVSLLSTAFLYFTAKGENLGELLQESAGRDIIQYSTSDNLEPITELPKPNQ